MLRRLQKSDIPVLTVIHRKAGYGFDLPDFEAREIGYVVEEGGKPVCYVGAELHAELVMIVDPEYGSPHQKMRMFASLHLPIAEELEARGVKSAYVSLDPAFKSFGRRLSQLGWNESLWRHFYLSVKDCLKALRKVA